MALARYTDLCIDAQDAPRMAPFWAAALRLEAQPAQDGGPVRLVGSGPTDGARVLRRPDPAAGTTWTVLADPVGNELCAFSDGGA